MFTRNNGKIASYGRTARIAPQTPVTFFYIAFLVICFWQAPAGAAPDNKDGKANAVKVETLKKDKDSSSDHV